MSLEQAKQVLRNHSFFAWDNEAYFVYTITSKLWQKLVQYLGALNHTHYIH